MQLNLPGDCDCDGRVTDYDVDTLVYAIQYGEQAWIGLFGTTAPCPYSNLDLSGDGTVDSGDHDPNNPLIDALVGAQLPATSRFVYDEENRLTQVRNLVAPLLTIQYDALGRRVETIDYQDGCTNGRRTRHIMNGLETIAEYVYSACTTGGGGT